MLKGYGTRLETLNSRMPTAIDDWSIRQVEFLAAEILSVT
jgi:hypothetical protein